MEKMAEFTSSQQKAYDIIMNEQDTFITGGPGTGKSFLIRAVLRSLREKGKNCIVCAPTGTAAVNVGGITVHKAFGFSTGPCITEKTHKISIRISKLVCAADVVIIDEVSICRMDMMDAILSSVHKARAKSGHNIQIVLFGDFCQLPPVINEDMGERELLQSYYGRPIGGGYAFQADGWRNAGLTVVELKETVRQKDDVFIRNLNLLRLGKPSAIRYFNSVASYVQDPKAVGLFAYNSGVDSMNREVLDELPGVYVTFEPIYYGQDIRDAVLPEPVMVKPGARVIITTNLGYSVSEDVGGSDRCGLWFHNGSTGEVVEAARDEDNPWNDYVIVKVDTGGIYMFRRRTQHIIDFRMDKDGKIRREVTGHISIMPVKLAYAVTIHRGQGQTYDSINLDPTCRSPGQLYVALSRLRSIEGLHLRKSIEQKDLRTDPLVIEFYEHLHEPDYIPSWIRDVEEDSDEAVVGPFELEEVKCVPENTKLPEIDKGPQRNDKCSLRRIGNSDWICNEGNGKTKIDGRKPNKAQKPVGRPSRYPNGSQVVRIPNDITEEIEWLLSVICPTSGMDMDELEIFKMMVYRMRETYTCKRGK